MMVVTMVDLKVVMMAAMMVEITVVTMVDLKVEKMVDCLAA